MPAARRSLSLSPELRCAAPAQPDLTSS